MISISVTLMSLKISKYHALPLSLIKYAANLINMLTFEHLPLLERLRQSILSNFGKRPSPKKTSTGYQKMCRCLCWSPEALRQLEVWEGGPELSVPLYRISLHCVGLHCMCGLGRYRGLSDARSGKPSLWIWLTTLWCWDVTAMQYWEFGRNIYCLSSGEMPIQWNAELTNKKIVFEY